MMPETPKGFADQMLARVVIGSSEGFKSKLSSQSQFRPPPRYDLVS